jgi:hypothetical protein
MSALALSIFRSPKPITRQPIKRAALEVGITVAVKQSNPGCEAFVGVIVERVTQQNSPDDANWAVKGVKFGNSDREQCNSALSIILESLRREFELATDSE